MANRMFRFFIALNLVLVLVLSRFERVCLEIRLVYAIAFTQNNFVSFSYLNRLIFRIDLDSLLSYSNEVWNKSAIFYQDFNVFNPHNF